MFGVGFSQLGQQTQSGWSARPVPGRRGASGLCSGKFRVFPIRGTGSYCGAAFGRYKTGGSSDARLRGLALGDRATYVPGVETAKRSSSLGSTYSVAWGGLL